MISTFRFGKRSNGPLYGKSPVDDMMYYPVSKAYVKNTNVCIKKFAAIIL